jgi:hypothetical protein
VQVMGLRVSEPTTHITPLPFIQTPRD